MISEQELTRAWSGSTQPVVSIICCTYNQEKFISRTLEGFLSQRTNFPFEVVVQNDASSDGTKQIIERFSQLYPSVIKAFHHSENVYSNGVKPGPMAIARSRGEFVAMCEGDDCWIDENKLQTQYDALTRHPEIDICFHPSEELRGGRSHCLINNHFVAEAIVPLSAVIEGGGGFMPTASLFIRKSALLPFPSWLVESAPVGDVFFQILGSVRGGALFLPEVMSIYRRFSEGSITERNAENGFSEVELRRRFNGYTLCFRELKKVLPTELGVNIEYALGVELFGSAIRALDNGYTELFVEITDEIELSVALRNRAFIALKLARFLPFLRGLVLGSWERRLLN